MGYNQSARIEMKRIQPQVRSWPLRVLFKLFIQPSRNPPPFSVIIAVAETVLFTCLVCSQSFNPHSNQNSQWFTLLLSNNAESVYLVTMGLMIGLIVRVLLCISGMRLVYVPVTAILFTTNCFILIRVIAWFLLLLNVLVDVLSHTELSFRTKNGNCETLNSVKIAHYAVVTCAIWFCYVSPIYLPTSMSAIISQGVPLAAFILLIILKSRSKQHSPMLKELAMRFYTLTISMYLKNIISIWFNPLRSQITTLITVVGSQVAYSVVRLVMEAKRDRKQDKVHNLVNNIDTFFEIYAYLYSDTYDDYLESVFAAFCQEDTNKLLESAGAQQTVQQEQMQPYFNQRQSNGFPFRTARMEGKTAHQLASKSSLIEQLTKGRRDSQMLAIAIKSKSILKKAIHDNESNRFKCSLIAIQIDYAVSHNIASSLQKLYEMKQQCRTLYWIESLCILKHIMKLEAMIQQSYAISCNSPPLYIEFFKNEHLRSNILKSSFQFLQLFRYVSSPTSSILFSKLSRLLTKMLDLAQKIDKTYTDTPLKCKDLEMLYVDYLYMVRRDVEKATAMFRSISIFEEDRHWLNIDNKIYLCLGIEQTQVFIENVGINLRKLLGFDRASVKNGSVSVFLPAFYQQSHSKKIEKSFELPTFDIENFSRETIIKHNDGYYVPVNLELKLVCCQKTGRLFFEGYFQLNEDASLNWMNYFFQNSEEERIIQIGAPLRDIVQLPPNKFVYVNEYFDNERSPSMCSLTEKEVKLTDSRKGTTDNNQMKYLCHNGMEYQYRKIKNFQGVSHSYAYYVCVNPQGKVSEGGLGKPEPFENYCSEFLKYQKYPTKYQDCDTHLEEFFGDKAEAKHKISKKLVLWLMGVVILMIIAGVAMQTMLIAKIRSSRNGNQAIVADFDNLVEFYHQINNFGLVLSKAAYLIGRNKSYNYPYYNIESLCLNLQYRNQMVGKFEDGNLTQSKVKSYKEQVSQLIAIVYQSIYIADVKTKNLVSSTITSIISALWGPGHQRYLNNYLKSAASSISENNKVKLVVGCCLALLIFAAYFIMIKVESIKRQNEYQSLNLLCGLNAAALLAHSAEEFLRRTVGGISEHDFQEANRDMFKQDAVANKTSLGSEISARENSVRGFFEESMINSTNRETKNFRNASTTPYNTLELKEKIEEDQTARKQQKIEPRSKISLFVWTSCLLSSVGFVAGSIITDQAGSKISLWRSLESLQVLLHRQVVLSSTMTLYLISTAQSSASKDFDAALQQYNERLATTIDFDEIRSTDFKNFTSYYQNFNYVYLCEYMRCDSKYKAQVNIIYSSAVHMLTSFMASNPSPNVSLASDSAQIELLFYAHYLLENTTYLILKSYFSDFAAYEQEKYAKITLFYDLQLTAFVIYALVAVGFYMFLFRRNRNHCLAILGIVKEQSYQVPEKTPSTSNE